MAESPSLPSFRPKPKLKEKWDLMSPETKKEQSDTIATQIQKVWKGHQTRKEYKWMIDKRKAKTHSKKDQLAAADKIKSSIKSINVPRTGTKNLQAESSPIKKSSLAKSKERESDLEESKKLTKTPATKRAMTKDSIKKTEKEQEVESVWELAKADKIRFIQRVILTEIINKAVLQGESLVLSRQIQTNYENRPVDKDIFTFSHEFQYTIADCLPHTLQSISSLGRILYLEQMGNLYQIDVTSEKQLSPYFLGVRMPLKYTPILDMICDTKSCRVYTLNALWKLEVWSLEQVSSLPLKRVPMVNCEIIKDYTKCYRSRYLLSKPSFLSMADSSNQILIVNTTCVDGNIVFVDPVSLSILKRIHLIFSEYEVPMYIKDAIEKLKAVFKNVKGSVSEILNKIGKGKETQEMRYEDFVKSLSEICKDIDSSLCIFLIFCGLY